MAQAITLLTSLVNSMCVVVVVAYVLTRLPLMNELLEGRVDLQKKLLLVLIFGAFSVYGTMSGVRIHDAVANTRYIGPVMAGLLGGPVVGLGAGLIGGAHRFLVGGFTYFSSSLSTVVAGLVAGVVCSSYRKKTGELMGVGRLALLAAALQVYHLAQILVLEKPYETALALIEAIGLPMILTNAGGAAIFAFIVANHVKERKTIAERDTYLKDKERIESELRVATDIQKSMVPRIFTTIPEREEIELYASLKPAKEVGGDLYDFALLQGDQLYFSIGDVSGKGVPAALFMAVTKTVLRTMAVLKLAPDEVLAQSNREIAADNDAMMFVTVFCGNLDLKTGRLTYSNAGHNPPLVLRRNGAVEWLAVPAGMALGMDPDAPYSTRTLQLEPGDCLLTYTDGVTEAQNSALMLYSEERLLETAKALTRASARETVEAITASAHAFAAGEAQSDDITVLALRYLKSPAVAASFV